MTETRLIESGRMGRVAFVRIAPNEDLVLGVEKVCVAQGFDHAFVRGALGSLADACLARADGSCQAIAGPAEAVTLVGEVRRQSDGSIRANLNGMVVDTDGRVCGGPFVAGANPVLVTFEVTLEEWLPSTAA